MYGPKQLIILPVAVAVDRRRLLRCHNYHRVDPFQKRFHLYMKTKTCL